MKKLLLMGAALLLSVAIQAQPTIDTSDWKEGSDISDAVGFGNRSFESAPLDYWSETHVGGNPTFTGGLAEVYDGHDCDLWQVLYLPAGTYTLECQGYYRNGTSWSEDPNTWNSGSWVNRAKLYAEVGTYDIDSEEFVESGGAFEAWLMPRLFDIQTDQLYWGPQEGEDGWPGWDMSDGYYNNTTYGPTSIPGSLVWFEAGKYQPYDDGDEVQYNTVTFFVAEDSWVKVGVKKTEAKSADSFMATNFRIIYVGDASEQVQIKLALKTLYAAQEKADALAESILNDIPALGVLCQDIIMTYEYDESSVESIQEATETYRNMLTQFQTALRDANSLRTLITSAEGLAESTDYKGKPDFLAAIEAAKLVAYDGEDGTEPTIESIDAYATAKAALADAQVAYILTQEVKNGYSDYSYVIDRPFFINNEYNPTWDEEEGVYKFSDEIENTWMTIQEQDYTSAMNEHSDWIPLLDEFPVTNNENAENCWVIHQTTWHGGGLGDVTLQHGYPAIGGWTADPSGNPEILKQTITGLPDGFYSMSALMCNAGADISDLMYVFIENSEGARETAPLTQKGNPWWGGNRDQWRQTVWEKLTTGMVQVTDGRVTIGASSDFFYAVTGFQLYYYGENPDFSDMIQQKKVVVQANAMNNLTFPGDIAKVDELLNSVVLPVEGFDAYDAANKALNEASDYINEAYNYLNRWTLIDDILNDQLNYEDNSPEYTILDNYAMEYVMYIGTGDEDTYLTAQDASATYNALKSYFNYRPQVEAVKDYYTEIPAIIENQNSQLKAATPITVELIETLRAELDDAYGMAMTGKNSVLFAELGADKATPENPVDITALLVNPSFDNGSNGWTGSITVDNNLHNAERFNTTFNFYQTLNTLPRGQYVAKVQAFYRDGGVGNVESGGYFNWWIAAAGDIELWDNHNVEFYAKTGTNEEISYITSICSEQFTERSMERIFDSVDPNSGEPLMDDKGNYILDENGNEIWVNLDTLWFRYDDESPNWQFDVAVTEEIQPEEFVTYFYPNSMAGTAARFEKNPEAYWNEVGIVVEEGESLTIGMRKSTGIDNDWCIFDNFRLYYLGTEGLPPMGINSANATEVAKKGIFNISGQQLTTPQRGLNIINGQKVLVK